MNSKYLGLAIPILRCVMTCMFVMCQPICAEEPGETAAFSFRQRTPVWEVAWTHQTPADGTYSRLTAATPYLSAKLTTKIHEVISESTRVVFSPHDLGRYGSPLGVDGAARAADIEFRTEKALGRMPRIEVREVPRMTLYLQTDGGVLAAVDGETGEELWSLALGSIGQIGGSPIANDKHVAVVHGNLLTVISLADGKVLWQVATTSIPASQLALDDTYVYLPLEKGVVEQFALADGGRFPRKIYAAGRVLEGCVLSHGLLTWVTDRGTLHTFDPATNKFRFRIEQRHALNGPPVHGADGRIYLSSVDGTVLAVDGATGKIVWEKLLEGSILEPPVVIDKMLISTTSLGITHCLATVDGATRWQRGDLGAVAARTGNSLACVADQRELQLVSLSDGQLRHRTALVGERLLFGNTLTDRVYLVNDHGRIRCLRRGDARWPTLTQTPMESAEKPSESDPPPANADPPPPETSEGQGDELETAGEADPDADPFGESPAEEPGEETPDENPFGESSDDEDPFGGGTEEEDNPFGL